MTNEKIVVLTVKSQKTPGEKVFRLHKKRAVLGSAESSDLRLDDAGVSPVHAILEVSGIDGKPVIYDLASESGVQVNGSATVQATLEPTDKVQIGPYMIAVSVQDLSAVPAQASRSVREAVGGQRLFLNEKEDLAPLLLESEAETIDIFDHRPESKQSLQVVMFYGETILDVEHFVKEKRVVIGPGSSDDFSIPPFMGQGKKGRFELVTNEKGSYFLHLHEGMKGVISQNGKMIALKDAMLTAPSAKSHPLMEKDFAKVEINDVSFFLSFSSAPPRLKFPKLMERDPFFARIWVTSLLLTGLLLFGVTSMKVSPTIEIEQLPERVATILYEPPKPVVEKPPVPKHKVQPVAEKPIEKPKPVEKPKPIKIALTPKPVTTPPKKDAVIAPKEAPKPAVKKEIVKAAPKPVPAKPAVLQKVAVQKKPGGGQEGAGAKAKGTEGSRGAENAPKKGPPQNKAERPGPVKKAGAATGNEGHSETSDMGLVDVFKNNKGVLNKILAGGKGAANGADKLAGYSGFTTFGKGGLGEAGAGAGGGGTSLGLGGLSDHGVGGGKHGKGLGALGSGSNMLGGSGKLPIEGGNGVTDLVVMGSIDPDAIARALAAHKDEIKYCYEKEINAERPDLAGRVGVGFVIGASGSVSKTWVTQTTLRNANAEHCILDVIKRIAFPPVLGGGEAQITKAFAFKPSNK